MSETPQKFKNRMAALAELHARGYSIKKSKLYKDVDAGILQMEADKTILAASLDKYINHPESKLETAHVQARAGKDLELREMTLKSKDQEFEINELKKKQLSYKTAILEKKFIAVSEVYRELAGRGAAIEQTLKTWSRLVSEDLAHKITAMVQAGASKKEIARVISNSHVEKIDEVLTVYVSSVIQVFFKDDDTTMKGD